MHACMKHKIKLTFEGADPIDSIMFTVTFMYMSLRFSHYVSISFPFLFLSAFNSASYDIGNLVCVLLSAEN